MYYPNFRYVVLAVASLLLLAACKRTNDTEADPAKLNVMYEVLYSGDGNATLRASVRFGGPTGGIDYNATPNRSFTFNGTKLYAESNSIYYSLNVSGQPDTGTFTYTDETGASFDMPLHFATQRSIPPSFTYVNRNADTTFTWLGDSLAGNEAIYLQIGNIGAEQSLPFAAYAPAIAILLERSVLSHLTPGTNNAIAQLYYTSQTYYTFGAPRGSSLTIHKILPAKIISVY